MRFLSVQKLTPLRLLAGSLIFLTCSSGLAQRPARTSSPEARRTPENQVFQFMQSGTCTAWPDSSVTKATLYLWIPERCKKLRGLLILATNVPEQMLAGHAAIRKVCRENNLGIVWAVPTFMNFRKSVSRDGQPLNMAMAHKTTVNFLQQLLNGLAQTSGYPEVATVPWLPMGESGHLLMVDALLEYSPERCLAGIYIKNNHLPPRNRTVPALVVYGTAQEWGQDKVNIRTRWNAVTDAWRMIRTERTRYPDWPLSYVIDGSSGHFDCAENLVLYFSAYIDAVAKARLARNGSDTLRPVHVQNGNAGFLAALPVPDSSAPTDRTLRQPVKPDTVQRGLPWYFTRSLADKARAIARINWQAGTQLPGFADEQGQPAPFTFNGISRLTVSSTDDDGITFRVRGRMLDQLPDNFVSAGEPIPSVKAEPVVEWVSGPYKPLGDGLFQIALDRTWPFTASYIGVRQPGNDSIRAVFQPCGLTLGRNTTGIVQNITFPKPADVRSGTASLVLSATSDAGLPVRYFVVTGPATVQANTVYFTRIPPKSKFPIAVTIAAWQWGRSKEPAIRMAETVYQTLLIYR